MSWFTSNKKSKPCNGERCDVIELCQSIVETGMGRLVPWFNRSCSRVKDGGSEITGEDPSEKTGILISAILKIVV
jgi:hypothetical protein